MASFAGRWTETRYLRAFVCIYNKLYKVVQCNFIFKSYIMCIYWQTYLQWFNSNDAVS